METLRIRIHEIFTSVDGEVNKWGQGFPTVFIRFQGCNLNCDYCDTKSSIPFTNIYTGAFTPEEILGYIKRTGFKKVTITGGEPLLQKEGFCALCNLLVAKNIKISVETNGSIDINDIAHAHANTVSRISWIVDYKHKHCRYAVSSFFERIPPIGDVWIKAIVETEEDFVPICEALSKAPPRLGGYRFALSPLLENISSMKVLSLMVKHADKFPFLMEKTVINNQLHKVFFMNEQKNTIFS